MEQRTRACRDGFHPLLFLMLFVLFFLHAPRRAQAYTNYTVGDKLGWFDNLMEPKVNYQKWVAGKNFSLGDFLIFNTDKNHTVIQTYNVTTYRKCDNNDAENDDTTQWSSGEPEFSTEAVTVAVPLLKEGMTYFFSSNYEGEQCKHGQHFKINVSHGKGLPESLKNPPEDAPAPNATDSGDSVPDTVIPSNFNNPRDTGAVKAASAACEGLDGVFGKKGGVLLLSSGLMILGLLMAF